MKFYNHADVAEKLGVSGATIIRWAFEKRIRVTGWVRNKPIFTEEQIEEIQKERKKYKTPAVKEDDEKPELCSA